MDYDKIFKKIAEYRNRKAEIEEELEALENEVKAYMSAMDIEELLGSEHKAIYQPITSNRFDTTAFKREHADMAKAYTKTSTTMRFTFR